MSGAWSAQVRQTAARMLQHLLIERVHGGLKRFDALSLRERAVVAFALLAICLVVWDSAVMRGIYARERVAREQLDRVVPEGIDSEAAVSDLQQMIEQEKQLQLDYYRKRGRLESQAASLVDPANMPKVLKSLLEASDGIALERLANLPVEEIRAAQPPPEAAVEVDTESGSEDRLEVVATAPAVAYLHGIEISVAGDYASINAFLARVERQPWRLLWRKIEMDASEYPRISARIAVATLSLEKHWLNL